MPQKKVLIIAHDFPPLTSVGALRPNSWFNHFFENNIYPIVVTRYWNKNNNNLVSQIQASEITKTKTTVTEVNTLIQAPFFPNLRDKLIIKYGFTKYSLIRKSLSFLEFYFKFLFSFFDNTNNIYKAADKYLENEKVDFIIATGEPWIVFKYAYLLSKKYHIPWVADYRDGWTTNIAYQEANGFKKILNNYWTRFFEKKYIDTCAFVNVSDPCEISKLKSIHPNKTFTNVQNGYDESLINPLLNTPQNENIFTISYAGTIYPFQDLESFLKGFLLFIEETNADDVIINFIGSNYYPEQVARIKNFNSSLIKYINCTSRIPQSEVVVELLKSHLLLILCNPNHVALPSKIFEYFSLNRKILVSINDQSNVEELMKECNGGYNCNNVDEIKNALIESYKEFKLSKKVNHKCSNYEKYSRSNQAKLFCQLIQTGIVTN